MRSQLGRRGDRRLTSTASFTDWYKGTDGNVPNSEWDLETVVLHELGHGLGFYSSFSVQSDNKGYRASRRRPLRFDANEWDKASGGNPMTSYANASTALQPQLTDGSPSTWEAATWRPPWVDEPSCTRPRPGNPVQATPISTRPAIGSGIGQWPDDAGAQQRRVDPRSWSGDGGYLPGHRLDDRGQLDDTTPPTVDPPTVTFTARRRWVRASTCSFRGLPRRTTPASPRTSFSARRAPGHGPPSPCRRQRQPLRRSRSREALTRRFASEPRMVPITPARGRPTPSASMSTLQETSGSVAYSGGWTHAALSGASGGSVDESSTTDATATFTFTGTSVAFVTARGASRGIAQITLDGDDKGAVDLFSATIKTKRVAWASAALAPGSHTLVVRVTGTKNPHATGTRIDVDAFLVWP